MKAVMNNIKNKIFIFRDYVRRKVAIFLFDRKRSTSFNTIDTNGKLRFLLVRWDAKLGDSIVCSWFYREIKKINQDNELIVICSSTLKDFYRDFWGADHILVSKKKPSYLDLVRISSQLGKIDYAVHFGERLKMRDMFFLYMLRAKNNVGIDDALNVFNIKMGEATKNKHFSEKFSLFLNQVGSVVIDSSYIIPQYPEVEQKIQVAMSLGLINICINPYGSGSARKIKKELMVLICNEILKEKNIALHILYMPEQYEDVAWISTKVDASDRLFFPSSNEVSIENLFSYLRLCDGLITVDTATVHIASGLRLPTLAIYVSAFGDEDQNFINWNPNNDLSTIVFANNASGNGVNSLSIEDFKEKFKQWMVFFEKN